MTVDNLNTSQTADDDYYKQTIPCRYYSPQPEGKRDKMNVASFENPPSPSSIQIREKGTIAGDSCCCGCLLACLLVFGISECCG